jgi:hypothetical protein
MLAQFRHKELRERAGDPAQIKTHAVLHRIQIQFFGRRGVHMHYCPENVNRECQNNQNNGGIDPVEICPEEQSPQGDRSSFGILVNPKPIGNRHSHTGSTGRLKPKLGCFRQLRVRNLICLCPIK